MRKALAVVVALIALVGSGCSGGKKPSADVYNNDPNALNIVMGSEQHLVFDQIVRPWCEKNGLNCTAKELGSVDQANLLSQDCSNLPPFDIFWFASTVFEQIGNERCNKLVDSKPMFTSPVVFAGWKHVMDGLGFAPGANTSIQQILDVVETGKAKVWITNPTQSNSGATTYFGFLNYFAGNPPGNFVYCLDGSGSMEGDGWNGVKQAADILFDPDSARKYMLLANPKDSTTVFIFDDGVKGGPWTVNGNDKNEMLGLRKDITDSSPGGGTNIRGCLQRAAEVFQGYGNDPRKKAVVLMTDGQDGGHDGAVISELAAMGIPVIAIGFGDVDERDLRDVIAAGTWGTYIHKDNVVSALREAAGFR